MGKKKEITTIILAGVDGNKKSFIRVDAIKFQSPLMNFHENLFNHEIDLFTYSILPHNCLLSPNKWPQATNYGNYHYYQTHNLLGFMQPLILTNAHLTFLLDITNL